MYRVFFDYCCTHAGDYSKIHSQGKPQPAFGRKLQIPKIKLQATLQNTKDKSIKASATNALIKRYLQTGKLQKAEKLFDDTSNLRAWGEKYYTFRDFIYYSQKAGNKQMAMKFWRKFANGNLRDFDMIQSMLQAGMKDELIGYYDEIAKKLPVSVAPAEAMKILNAKQ